MGRMTRLVTLNLSDNQLHDLPLSLGYCYGLAKFGAGINLERNPIEDQEMIKKFRIGPDHMVDFLEKRMQIKGVPKFTEMTVPYASVVTKKIEEKKNTTTTESPLLMPPVKQTPKVSLPEKLIVLKKWAHTTIQQELRFQLNKLQEKAIAATDPQQIVSIAQLVKELKPTVERARTTLPPFDIPKVVPASSDKMDQLKAVISSATSEIALTLRGIQKVLENTDSSREVIDMVQLVKDLKVVLEKA